jgi:hypothetical protein
MTMFARSIGGRGIVSTVFIICIVVDITYESIIVAIVVAVAVSTITTEHEGFIIIVNDGDCLVCLLTTVGASI